MNKAMAIKRMLQMYNRRSDENSMMNYLSVCERYSNDSVSRVIQSLIGLYDTCPDPRKLKIALERDEVHARQHGPCHECGGLGYITLQRSEDDDGLEQHLKGRHERCHLQCELRPGHPTLMTKREAMMTGYAQILAKIVARRAIDGEAIRTIRDWSRYVWTREAFDDFVSLVSENVNMMLLVMAELAIESVDVGDCQTEALKAAQDVLSRARMMPKTSLFKPVNR